MKKKTINLSEMLTSEEFQEKKEAYLKFLKESPQYSLLVDPENKYSFTEDEKTFIGLYCEFKNIELASLLSKLPVEKALSVFGSYAAQQEIRRINNAMYQQQFATKMLTLEQIGGYLSCLLTDNVPSGDRLRGSDKLQVTNTLLKIHELLNNSKAKPKDIIDIDVEEELSSLSLEALKNLLDVSKNEENKKSKDEIIEEFKSYNNLTDEDINYLKSLSVKELLELLNTLNTKLEEEKNK